MQQAEQHRASFQACSSPGNSPRTAGRAGGRAAAGRAGGRMACHRSRTEGPRRPPPAMTCCSSEPPGAEAAGHLVRAERGAQAHAPTGNDVLLVQPAPAPLAAAADLATPSSADLTLIENVRTAILSSSPPVPHVLVALVSVLSCPRAGQHRLGREARRLRSIREVHASSADAARTAERGAAMPKRLSHNGYQKASPHSCQPECTSI